MFSCRLTVNRRVLFLAIGWLAGAISFPGSDNAYAQSDTSTDQQVRSWPRFLGTTYDGTANHAAPDIDWRQAPQFLWSLEVGDGYGIGSIDDGLLYQSDGAWIDDDEGRFSAGGIAERLRCLDLSDGQTRWSKSNPIRYRDMLGYEAGPRTSPTIHEDRIITHGVTGLLNCRDKETGRLLWSVDTFDAYGVVQNFFGVASAPLVIDDLVIVMVGGSPPEDQNFPPMRLDRVSPNGTALVAFDLESGKQRWACGDDLASYSSPIPWSVDGETLVLLFARSGLMAVDPKTGKPLWNFVHRSGMLESVNGIVPLVDGKRIFVSECYEVGSVLLEANRSGAKVVWRDPPRNRRKQSMRCHWSTPVLVDGFVFGCSGRNAPDSDFRCIDFATGEVQWSDPRRIRSSVTRVDEHLVIWEERGLLQVIETNPKQLEVVSEWNLSRPEGARPALRYPCWSAPVIVDDLMLLRGDDQVVCFRLARSDDSDAR